MEMEIEKPGDVFRRAAAIFADRGFYQGGFFSPRGGVCAIGAVALATGSMMRVFWAVSLANAVTGHALSLAQFNDAADTTAEEVHLALLLLGELADSFAQDAEVAASIRAQLDEVARAVPVANDNPVPVPA